MYVCEMRSNRVTCFIATSHVNEVSHFIVNIASTTLMHVVLEISILTGH